MPYVIPLRQARQPQQSAAMAFACPPSVTRMRNLSHSAFICTSTSTCVKHSVNWAQTNKSSRSRITTVTAAANPNANANAPTPDGLQPFSGPPSLMRISRSLWKFSRPHTVYGTIISIMSVSFLALHHYPPNLLHEALTPFATALIPALLLNVYIVGLNQLYDIGIDRINKPFLPLPSGAMTTSDAVFVIAVSLLSGLAFCSAPAATPALRVVLMASAALGTLYSMPPFRLKRFALLASMAILTVRGLLVNIGFFLHAATAAATAAPRSVLGGAVGSALPPVIAFAASFFTLFGIVIALLKDVPDIKGDRLFGIRTFSVRVGARAIFKACVALLVVMFLAAGGFYFSVGSSWLGRIGSLCVHVAMAGYLAWRSRGVDANDASKVTAYYMLSWKAFYAEYLLLPLAVL